MFVKHVQTGNLIEAEIVRLEEKDFKLINRKDSQFDFNWKKLEDGEFYKLGLKESKMILGLMCITDHQDPYIDAVEIQLIELSRNNKGKIKQYDFVAGCLIAFACLQSIRLGHDGYIFLNPKSGLIDHYIKQYGLKYIPPIAGSISGKMVANSYISLQLIKQFLGEII